MYIKRFLEEEVLVASKSFPIVLVTGPRQVGKTTMLEKIKDDNRKYVSLDHPIARDMAKTDPELFLERYSPPVIIDEIQYAPELLSFIKMYVDRNKQPGDFWLTGSQMFHLMKNASESLAGRVAVIQMQGLSGSELYGSNHGVFTTNLKLLIERMASQRKQNLSQVYEHIFYGSMPALQKNYEDRERFYSSYVDTYLQRDIRDLTQVGDELTFFRFMCVCAARTSQMLNYSELAREVGISQPTAKHWLSLLVSSGIVTLVEPYYNNRLKRLVKSPKLYFMDTGLCAFLTRWDGPETLEISAMSGAFFETYVIGEIIKSFLNNGKRPPIFYYRDSDQKEIDLVIEQNNMLFPIEIKKSANPGKKAVQHFSVLKKSDKDLGDGGVVCLVSDVLPIDQRNCFIPVWLI